AVTSSTGRELWISDGTSAGTTLVQDIFPGSQSSGLVSLKPLANSLIFTANDGVHGKEMWRSDGTPAETKLVIDIADSCTDNAWPFDITPSGDGVMFRADDGVHGYELWFSDGTATGTEMVADINPGPEYSGTGSSTYAELDGTFYFTALTPANGTELWRTQGDAATTQLVKDIRPGSVSADI